MRRTCFHCGEPEQERPYFGECPLCKEQRVAPLKFFCSRECQKAAWKEHKKWRSLVPTARVLCGWRSVQSK